MKIRIQQATAQSIYNVPVCLMHARRSLAMITQREQTETTTREHNIARMVIEG